MNKIKKYHRNIIKALENKFFKISKISKDYIYGALIVAHTFNGVYIFREFKICIKLCKDKFYACYEINNEIPNDYHHHTDSEDPILKTTSLCLAPNAEIESFLNKSTDLSEVIDNFIIPYFFNFSYYDKFGEEMWSGYAHGKEGIKEYYLEKFNIVDEVLLVRLMELIQKNKLFYSCPCGSKSEFKRCHYKFVKDIPIKSLKNDSFKFFKDNKKSKWNIKKSSWI